MTTKLTTKLRREVTRRNRIWAKASPNQEIRERNKKWKAALPHERRVMLAKDARDRLRKGKFKAQHGHWFTIRTNFNQYASRVGVLKGTVDCSCCAAGSLFLARVMFGGVSLTDRSGEKRGLYGIAKHSEWPLENLRLIEAAFEGRSGGCIGLDDACAVKLHKFQNETYDGGKKRLISILDNIINNNGLFILPD